MKKLAFTAAVIVVISAFGASGIAIAAHKGARGHRDGERMIGRLIDDTNVQERLDLSADQVARLREIRDDAKASIGQLRAQAIKTRAELRAALLDTRASRQELERRAEEIRESVGAISKEVTKRLLDARDVLSADQREKLRTIIGERVGKARRGVMRGRRHHGRHERAPEADTDHGSTDDGSSDSQPEDE